MKILWGCFAFLFWTVSVAGAEEERGRDRVTYETPHGLITVAAALVMVHEIEGESVLLARGHSTLVFHGKERTYVATGSAMKWYFETEEIHVFGPYLMKLGENEFESVRDPIKRSKNELQLHYSTGRHVVVGCGARTILSDKEQMKELEKKWEEETEEMRKRCATALKNAPKPKAAEEAEAKKKEGE